MGHSYLGESPRCHIVGSTTLNILQQGWDCSRFLSCATVEKDIGKWGGVNALESQKVAGSEGTAGCNEVMTQNTYAFAEGQHWGCHQSIRNSEHDYCLLTPLS